MSGHTFQYELFTNFGCPTDVSTCSDETRPQSGVVPSHWSTSLDVSSLSRNVSSLVSAHHRPRRVWGRTHSRVPPGTSGSTEQGGTVTLGTRVVVRVIVTLSVGVFDFCVTRDSTLESPRPSPTPECRPRTEWVPFPTFLPSLL